jgi:hypothetical protein
VNRGILQTALTNKTLRLELEYREPSARWEGELIFANEKPGSHPSTSEEFADLLSAM